MARYRKKPVGVEAMQWRPDDPQAAGQMIGWIGSHGGDVRIESGLGGSCPLTVTTMQGNRAQAKPGDWIVQEAGVGDRFYPVDQFVFGLTYEAVS